MKAAAAAADEDEEDKLVLEDKNKKMADGILRGNLILSDSGWNPFLVADREFSVCKPNQRGTSTF